MSFMGNLSGVYGERVGVASQEEKLLSWFCIVFRVSTTIENSPSTVKQFLA